MPASCTGHAWNRQDAEAEDVQLRTRCNHEARATLAPREVRFDRRMHPPSPLNLHHLRIQTVSEVFSVCAERNGS